MLLQKELYLIHSTNTAVMIIYLSFLFFIRSLSNNIVATPATRNPKIEITVPLTFTELLIIPVKLLIIAKIIPHKQTAKITFDSIL